MILVTVGTHEQPFDRLIAAVAALPGDEALVVQYGTSALRDGRGEWIDFLSFDDLAQLAEQARAMVCHAGVGSIVLARRYCHRPIVMARRPKFGEHVDEHQLSLTRRLAAAGLVTAVDSAAQLRAAVETEALAPAPAAATSLRGPSALSADVRDVLFGLGAEARAA